MKTNLIETASGERVEYREGMDLGSKSQHTKGPWVWSEMDEPFPFRTKSGTAVNHRHPANARLIASAPDMAKELAQLKAELEKLKDLSSTLLAHPYLLERYKSITQDNADSEDGRFCQAFEACRSATYS